MPRVITVDVRKCMGCHSCEIACAIAHSEAKTLFEAIGERPLPQPRVSVLAVGEAAIPLQCRHCEDAPCVEICPTGALQKPDSEGPVTIDHELCIGCKSCIIVCPFGVIAMSADGKTIVKCDMCIERLERDEQPACVEACPTGAMQLVSVDELTAAARGRTASEIVTVLAEQGGKANQG